MHSDVVVQAILISLLAICVFGLGSDLVKLVWEKLFGTKKDKEKKEKKEKKAGVFVACFSWFFHVRKERPGFFPTMPIQGSIVAFGVQGFSLSLGYWTLKNRVAMDLGFSIYPSLPGVTWG